MPIKPELTFSGMEITKGNLVKAEFDLYMEMDTNTECLVSWYYFKVHTTNLDRGSKIRLNLRNYVRSKSLYQEGMLPRFSYCNSDGDPGQWATSGEVTSNVKFYPSDMATFDFEYQTKDKHFFTMSFIYTVMSMDEVIAFAYD